VRYVLIEEILSVPFLTLVIMPYWKQPNNFLNSSIILNKTYVSYTFI